MKRRPEDFIKFFAGLIATGFLVGIMTPKTTAKDAKNPSDKKEIERIITRNPVSKELLANTQEAQCKIRDRAASNIYFILNRDLNVFRADEAFFTAEYNKLTNLEKDEFKRFLAWASLSKTIKKIYISDLYEILIDGVTIYNNEYDDKECFLIHALWAASRNIIARTISVDNKFSIPMSKLTSIIKTNIQSETITITDKMLSANRSFSMSKGLICKLLATMSAWKPSFEKIDSNVQKDSVNYIKRTNWNWVAENIDRNKLLEIKTHDECGEFTFCADTTNQVVRDLVLEDIHKYTKATRAIALLTKEHE